MTQRRNPLPEEPHEEPDAGPPDAEQKRRLAEVFGDALPESTRDDRPEEWGEDRGRDSGEEWLRNQVPPHHG